MSFFLGEFSVLDPFSKILASLKPNCSGAKAWPFLKDSLHLEVYSAPKKKIHAWKSKKILHHATKMMIIYSILLGFTMYPRKFHKTNPHTGCRT